MKRRLCLLLVLILILSFSGQAFADYDVLYCRMCGRQIPTDSKVCPYCGVAVVHVGENKTGAAKAAVPSTQTTQTVQSSVQTVQTQTAPGPFNTTLDYSTGFVVNSGKVRVTKSPTSESVPYGGSCMFIAHASNASSVTWYIANTDGSAILTAYEAADNVSGLYVSGGNSDTLSLSGIPSWMNGYQVQACFTGEGGPVYTDIAKIWTYEETAQRDCRWRPDWDWWTYNAPYCPPGPTVPGYDPSDTTPNVRPTPPGPVWNPGNNPPAPPTGSSQTLFFPGGNQMPSFPGGNPPPPGNT